MGGSAVSQIPLDCSMYFDRDCDDYPVFLLELTHPDYEGLLRLCSSNVQRIGEWEDGAPQYGVMSTLGGTELNPYIFGSDGAHATVTGRRRRAYGIPYSVQDE